VRVGAALTSRQRQVLELLAKGLTNGEIATALGIGLSTVKTHVENLLRALDVTNRTEAVALAAGMAATPGAHDAPAFEDRPAVAVLRLELLRDDHATRTFAVGLADDLITLLSKWRWFPVIARSTSFYFGSDQPAARLRELTGADYLIGGSVSSDARRLRVTMRLEDARLERCLWSERFEIAAEDIFALQHEVAADVVGKAYPELLRAEGRAARSAGAGADLSAWQLAHDGLLSLDVRSRSEIQRAMRLFDRALELEPRFMLPLYGRGLALFQQISNQWTADIPAACATLARCAERALEVDDGDAAGWFLRGRAAIAVGDVQRTIPPLERATDINPSHAPARAVLGQARILEGDLSGFDSLKLAARLSPRAYGAGLAFAHFAACSYAEAASTCREALVLRPEYIFGHALLCAALALAEDTRAASVEGRRLLELNPGFRLSGIRHAVPDGRHEVADRLVEGLRLAGLPD
jgi:TolB-like protein